MAAKAAIRPALMSILHDCAPTELADGIVVDKMDTYLAAQQVDVAVDGQYSKKTMLFNAPEALIKKFITGNYGKVHYKSPDGNFAEISDSGIVLLKRKGTDNRFIMVERGSIRPDILNKYNVEVL